MDPASEDRCFDIGCLCVAIALIVLGWIAIFSDPKYWIACGVVLGGWWVIGSVRMKGHRARDAAAFAEIFEVLGSSKPSLEVGYHYGFNYFTVTFSSEADMEKAESLGLIERFQDRIQELYGHRGSKRNPFDAERAVYATYEGRTYESVAIPPK